MEGQFQEVSISMHNYGNDNKRFWFQSQSEQDQWNIGRIEGFCEQVKTVVISKWIKSDCQKEKDANMT